MEMFCNVFVSHNFCSDKNNIKKVSEPFISARCIRNFTAKTPTEYNGKPCFVISEMPKKFHACPGKNRSTELDLDLDQPRPYNNSSEYDYLW